LPKAFWPLYAEICLSREAGQSFRSASYFDLLRNYRRHGWIVSYLFGVSPALCRSFLQGRSDAGLEPLGADTLIGPYATSLRMSDIGYRNRNPAAAQISVNSLGEYLHDLRRAIRAPYAPFLALGVKRDGEYQQLSGNALQIENEYYSYVRPKRTLRAGERTTAALARAGVEYVEVRALDNSAFDAVGVNLRKLHFLEALLIMLLFKASPPIDGVEEEAIERNHLAVARRGREPALNLERDGRRVSMRSWGAELLESMQGICELLDAAHPQRPYVAALREQRLKLEEVEHTPSARLLRALRQHFGNLGFVAAAYNAGAHRVGEWLDHHRALPRETRNYVVRVTGRTIEAWRKSPLDDSRLTFARPLPCRKLPAFADLEQALLRQARQRSETVQIRLDTGKKARNYHGGGHEAAHRQRPAHEKRRIA